ncbi:MAG: DUF1080 domain-containing protein [Verrucomicrobiota bacterium]
MKKYSLFITTLLLGGFLISCNEAASEPGSSDAEVVFNGENLEGWSFDPKNWEVVDGVIIGTTDEANPLPYNQFLIWDGAPLEDFELSVQLKLTSDGNNSGVQYRAVAIEGSDFAVGGYQCDMHPAIWANGMLYDEKGRGILCKRGSKVVINGEGRAFIVGELPAEPEFDTGEFNTYRVVAKGNHLQHFINGVQTADVIDHNEKNRELAGLLAFQIHRGPAMKIEIKDIELTRLPKAEVIAPDATPIPEGAEMVNPPKPKGGAKGKSKAPKGKGKAKEKAK